MIEWLQQKKENTHETKNRNQHAALQSDDGTRLPGDGKLSGGLSITWVMRNPRFMLPRPFMPVMMTIRFPALSRFARFREPAVISNRKVTTCFAPCRPKSERPPRLISVTIFGRIQHHPKGFVSASPVLTLTMARMRGRLLRIRAMRPRIRLRMCPLPSAFSMRIR